MSGPFKAAHAQAAHWGHAAKACRDALGELPGGDALGFVYVTPQFADDFASIVTFLRETTPVTAWVGGVGLGVMADGHESHDGGALAVMVGALPGDSFRIFESDGDLALLRRTHGAWLAGQSRVAGLVHGDPRRPEVAEHVAGLAAATDAFLIGGLTAAQTEADQVAGRVTGAALSGVLLGSEVSLVTGLSQGCSPIGAAHRVTAAAEGVVRELDGRPALEVLRAEAGEIIARDLRRAAGYIHAALPVAGSDIGDYLVRNLAGIDPQRGWLAIAAPVATGDSLMFVRRDANAAQRDFRRMLDDLRRRAAPPAASAPAIRGGVYVSCVARGPRMFGAEGREVALIHQALGRFPLVGFYANGEIAGDRLYAYTGVLTLFL